MFHKVLLTYTILILLLHKALIVYNFSFIILIGLFGIIGSIIGGNAAFLMSQNVLNTVFAIFLLIVSFNLYLKKD